MFYVICNDTPQNQNKNNRRTLRNLKKVTHHTWLENDQLITNFLHVPY